jgi:hypothetical protein
MSLQRPIFVVGCPRSGTTLVQCILSAGSAAFSLPETHFFSEVLPAVDEVRPWAPIEGEPEPDTIVDAAALVTLRRAFEASAEVMLDEAFWTVLAAQPRLTRRDVFVHIVERFRPAVGLRAIEKTPRHALHLDTITSYFPDARIVNVVRDPIDVASSLLAVPFATSRSVLSHAQRWLESIRAADGFASRRPGRMHTVLYEELVRAPRAQVVALCRTMDLPYEPRMLEEFGREATRNVGRGESWKRDVKSGVIVDRNGVWRSRMTPGQAWLVAQATSPERRRFGYVQRPPASLRSIGAAGLHEANVRFHEARSSTGVVGAARHAGSVLKTLSAA